ncbi:hypothetical protein HB375_17895, partial [Microvirga sp. c23x22]|nr:hypothetical protein [Microvirga terricola]
MPLTLTLQSFSRLSATSVISPVSTAADGTQGDSHSYTADFSRDGRYVIFESSATNLTTTDTTGDTGLFRKDLWTGTITSLSTAADGEQGNGGSWMAQLSADGRYAVFQSAATNLATGDTNGKYDIFWKDLKTGIVALVSTAADGTQGGGNSYRPVLSADGRYVVFESEAANLVANDTNNAPDIFRKDMLTGEIVRLSTASGAVQANGDSFEAQLSANGRFMVFASSASNLARGDTNGTYDIFYKDLTTGAVSCLSTAPDGASGNARSSTAALSADGRYVVFNSNASNLVANDTNNAPDIFRKDLVTGEIVLVSTAANGTHGNNHSFDAKISADGRYVVFESEADNLVPGDTNNRYDVFRKDLVTGEIVRISTAANGAAGDDDSNEANISPDGRYVLFSSQATNLVPGDTNTSEDVFLVDTNYIAQGAAIAAGRYVEARFGVGAASSVSVAWGDGAVDTLTPAGGLASFGHAYATSTGLKAALATVKENGQSWTVPYLVNVAAGTMTRDTAAVATLTGGTANDILTGDAFANRIYGGLGKDTLSGGA